MSGRETRGSVGASLREAGSRATHEAAGAASPKASIPNAGRLLTKELRYAVHEQLLAVFRASVSAAYARQVLQGFTPDVMARRIGWKLAKVERLLLVPRGITLDQLSGVCFAMQCEPEFGTDSEGRMVVGVRPWPQEYADRLEGRAPQGIEAGTGETRTRLDPKDESPVANGDAPEPSPEVSND